MGRRKWKLYQDVLLARNLPLPQPSDESDALSDSVSVSVSQQAEDEEAHMIATTEAIQRHSGAAELAPADHQHPPDHHHHHPDHHHPQQPTPSPIALDEDSNPAKTKHDSDPEPEPDPESESPDASAPAPAPSSTPPAGLKIKTIEQINTVGVDGTADSKDGETILESLIKRSSSGPPSRRPLPVDWTPQDKCHFCEDGELVRPAAPAEQPPAAEQPPSPAESESESSSSRSGTSPPRSQFLLSQQAQALAHFLQLQQQVGAPQTMNQVESMAASLAAVAALGGGPALPPGLGLCPPAAFLTPWYLNANQRPSTTPERVNADAEKPSVGSSLSSPLQTEQPLDLSSKSAGPNSQDSSEAKSLSSTSLEAKLLSMAPSALANLRAPPIDPKQMYNRSKPRLAAPGGRRAYSEAELQAALRDIQSGRLGTRRAAVLYNIPRSTLRNKVYKLAVERQRESTLPGTLASAMDRDDSNDMGDDIDDDKDSIMDEEKDEERETRPSLSMEDILRFSQMDHASENLKTLLQKGSQKFFDLESPKREAAASDLWPAIDPSAMAPYIQSLLMAGGLAGSFPKPDDSTAPTMPEIVRLLAEERQNILKEHLMKQDHLNNGKQTDQSNEDLSKRSFSRQSSSTNSVIIKNERSSPGRKTDSPEVPMDTSEQNPGTESRDSPSNVILRIPSFKPLANTPNSNKNGGEAFPGPATPPLPFFARSPHPDQAINVTPRTGDHMSPPLVHSKNMFSLRDVIAKSISQKFQQQVPSTGNHNDLSQIKMESQNMDGMAALNSFKRGGFTPPVGGQGISVIKNLTSHDLSRNFSNNNSGNQSQQNNATGGKGTRPKRGKYRNYDRDSLVEAVKAVQRGEMSVHRAGSYYGVPHSTLEYKVKERHLMRPRKREPKNPNPEEKTGILSASKPNDIPGSGTLRIDVKPKVAQKPPTKPTFPANSPNGIKMPSMFDPAMALGYNPAPFPFWTHPPPFHGIPVEYSPRNPGASGSFPPNAESFFASQMMQRLQEESARHPGLSSSAQKASTLKSVRDIAEFYEGSAATNGSYLEEIIKSSLEQNPQRTRPSGIEEVDGRRHRPDNLLIAEEMREAVRKVRAREAGAAPSTPTATPTPKPEPASSPSPQTS